MNKYTIHTKLLQVLSEKFTDKSLLTKTLMELLKMEKEAVYRRLRGDVVFTFEEAAIIAENIGISLDTILEIDISRSGPFRLVLVDFEFPDKEDYEMCESFIRLLKVLNSDPAARRIEAWNTLPFPFTYQYPLLTQFYYLKWIYQFKNYDPPKTFKEVLIPEKYVRLQQMTLEETKKLAYNEYILSHTIFQDLIKDITHFYFLQLIELEEIKKIQEELNRYIDNLEQIAIKGYMEGSDNQFIIYVSNIKVETNQCSIQSDLYSFCMFNVLSFNAASSVKNTTDNHIQNWFTSLKRLSHQISQSGEKERIRFFQKQRKYIEKLSGLISD